MKTSVDDDAEKKGLLKTVNILMNAGGEVNIQGDQGDTPLLLATEKGWVKLVRTFLNEGADPFVKNSEGDTPLQLARKHQHQTIVKLLERKIDNRMDRFWDQDFEKSDDGEMIKGLIEDLGARSYSKRQEAVKRLRAMGRKAIYYLKKNRDHENPEVRKRVKSITREIVMNSMQEQ